MENYGNPDIVSDAFVGQSMKFKSIQNDSAAMLEYEILLKKCVLILQRLENFGELNILDRISEPAAKIRNDSIKLKKPNPVANQKRYGEKTSNSKLCQFCN